MCYNHNMYVDYLTLACLRDRLDALLGARVQRVVLPDDRSVGLELYARQRFQLLVSAAPQNPRMLIVPYKLRRGVATATPLLLSLRKWVRGARLVNVTQPPWERILELHFEGRAGPCCLIAELIGRYSNVILVGPDGCVLEAMTHVGPDINRYRVTLPHRPYQPPPIPPGRRPPTGVTSGEWAAILASGEVDVPLHHLLPRRLLGVSPMAAREIAVRAAGDPEAPAHVVAPQAVAEAVAALFAPAEGHASWAPHVALGEGEGEEDGERRVIAFAPYEPRQFKRVERVSYVSDAMWRYFRQRLPSDPYTEVRQHVQELIDEARSRVDHALAQVRSEMIEGEALNELREAGELLLIYQRRVERGADRVTVPDHGGDPRTIELDPALTPVENAQAYFRRYRKAARAIQELPARIETLETDRAYLEQLSNDLALSESRPEIEAVRHALAEAGWAPPASRCSGQVEGPRRFRVHGFLVYIGRNARQNEEVTFERAGPCDLWLHVRGLPGAHVVVKSGGQDVPERVIRRAAELAAYYSPARDGGPVDVDVTERRFVKRVRGGHPGHVTYRNEQTVRVEARGREVSGE